MNLRNHHPTRKHRPGSRRSHSGMMTATSAGRCVPLEALDTSFPRSRAATLTAVLTN